MSCWCCFEQTTIEFVSSFVIPYDCLLDRQKKRKKKQDLVPVCFYFSLVVLLLFSSLLYTQLNRTVAIWNDMGRRKLIARSDQIRSDQIRTDQIRSEPNGIKQNRIE